jgi:hypothetical protein
MLIYRAVASTAIAGSAIVDMWATAQPSGDPSLIALVAGVNLVSLAVVRAAWKRAVAKHIYTYLKSGPTIELILREYADRHATPPEKR